MGCEEILASSFMDFKFRIRVMLGQKVSYSRGKSDLLPDIFKWQPQRTEEV